MEKKGVTFEVDHLLKSSYKQVSEVEKYYNLRWNKWTDKYNISRAQNTKDTRSGGPWTQSLPTLARLLAH